MQMTMMKICKTNDTGQESKEASRWPQMPPGTKRSHHRHIILLTNAAASASATRSKRPCRADFSS
jgi:hypothetical protein